MPNIIKHPQVLIYNHKYIAIMKAGLLILFFIGFLSAGNIYGQSSSVNKTSFFNDTSILNATITTNLTKLFNQKKEGSQFHATFETKLPDGTSTNDHVILELRGHSRKDLCYIPPLKVVFKNHATSSFSTLGSLKLVSQCKTSGAYDQFLLKEFIIYRIYNLLTDMSFRVRLVDVNLVDSSGKKKTVTEHAFFMEDIKDLAKRNNCRDWKDRKLYSEDADRRQMTMVAIFEYMIGNTDWGVGVNHNTRYIISKTDSLARPFAVPYDFDYSGFVNTDYAIPDENFEIQSVRERVYRGFPRTIDELNEVLNIYKRQKDSIYSLINNFELLSAKSKKEIIIYLDDFYKQISNQDMVKLIFIKNAATTD